MRILLHFPLLYRVCGRRRLGYGCLDNASAPGNGRVGPLKTRLNGAGNAVTLAWRHGAIVSQHCVGIPETADGHSALH